MDIKNMAAVEKIGTSSEIKSNTKSMKSLLDTFSFFPKKKNCAKRKKSMIKI